MKGLCQANCDECPTRTRCKGCLATQGRPFGGNCTAAEYIKVGGPESYIQFKERLLSEINGILSGLGLPCAEALYELTGSYVNLAYRLPSGDEVRFLNDAEIYLGTQIEFPGLERCCGVVANADFILICTYGENGTDPELVCYRKR